MGKTELLAVWCASAAVLFAPPQDQPIELGLETDVRRLKPAETLEVLVWFRYSGSREIRGDSFVPALRYRRKGRTEWMSPAGWVSVAPGPHTIKPGETVFSLRWFGYNSYARGEPPHAFAEPGVYELRADMGGVEGTDRVFSPVLEIEVIPCEADSEKRAVERLLNTAIDPRRKLAYALSPFGTSSLSWSADEAKSVQDALAGLAREFEGTIYANYARLAAAQLYWYGPSEVRNHQKAGELLLALSKCQDKLWRIRGTFELAQFMAEKDLQEGLRLARECLALEPGPFYRYRSERLIRSIETGAFRPLSGAPQAGPSKARVDPSRIPGWNRWDGRRVRPVAAPEGWKLDLYVPDELEGPWVPVQTLALIINNSRAAREIPEGRLVLKVRRKSSDRWLEADMSEFERAPRESENRQEEDDDPEEADDETLQPGEVYSLSLRIAMGEDGTHPLAEPGEYEAVLEFGELRSPVRAFRVRELSAADREWLQDLRARGLTVGLGWWHERFRNQDQVEEAKRFLETKGDSAYRPYLLLGIASWTYVMAFIERSAGDRSKAQKMARDVIEQYLVPASRGRGPACATALNAIIRVAEEFDLPGYDPKALCEQGLGKEPDPGTWWSLRQRLAQEVHFEE